MKRKSLSRWSLGWAVAITAAILTCASANAGDSGPTLSFDVKEGLNLNSFLRSGPVAAHLVLRSGLDPRILIAFPAGNSGSALWFSHTDAPVDWQLVSPPQVVSIQDDKGRPLYGMAVQAMATAQRLTIKKVLLSSVRVFRDYQYSGKSPTEVDTQPVIHGQTISWKRDRLDGAAGYHLRIEITHGRVADGQLLAGDDGKIRMTIVSATGETPLTPLSGRELLIDGARDDLAARNTLEFLSYREKFLAGSWRFNTYFGRDTLMSIRLLLPALAPGAVEAGLGAVMTRLSPTGEVAHEEDIGEYAVLDHMHTGGIRSDTPVFDYKMIDANYMLPAVLGAWLLDDPRGRLRAAEFLARPDGSTRVGGGRALGNDLIANLRFVVDSAAGFARDPQVPQLIPIKEGHLAGQWRDSDEGIGRGRYPYDVNAVFVPAALEATSRLLSSGLLDSFLNSEDRAVLAGAASMAQVWRSAAKPLFEVEIANLEARKQISAYCSSLGVSPAHALQSLGKSKLQFHALALEINGRPIPIVNSDEAFDLLFGAPDSEALSRTVTAVMRPFPAGLMTDVGVVVANPVFASPEIQARFTRNDYHGTVVWSWQQAVFAAGLERQLLRKDLPFTVREKMVGAQRLLWRTIEANRSISNSELWSWTYQHGAYVIAPFGASGADADESNAAQLWSTVYLAIHPPSQSTH